MVNVLKDKIYLWDFHKNELINMNYHSLYCCNRLGWEPVLKDFAESIKVSNDDLDFITVEQKERVDEYYRNREDYDMTYIQVVDYIQALDKGIL